MPRPKIDPFISLIGEADFWGALRASATAPEQELLRQAIALGIAGKRKAAYARLADYHRSRLAEEYAALKAELVAADMRAEGHSHQTPEDLLHNRINVWHSTVVQFGEEIDWDYNYTDNYGFHYLFWLRPGIRELMLTGDPRYHEKLLQIVLSYYRARNRLYHPSRNWHLVYYELGCWSKTKQLLPLYLALLYTGELPTAAHEAFLKLFLGFARSLYRLQEGGYRGGNWQIVGCSALLTLARVFPELTEAPFWEARALPLLRQHLTDDFFTDGGHKERCWGYGQMSLDGIVAAYQVARRHGGLGADDGLFLRGIRRAYRWYAKTLGPGERKPAFGDCALNSGAHLLDAAQRFFPRGTPRDLGVDRTKSYLLKPSGFAIMRNGDQPDSAYLNLSFGQWAGWHSHMDVLSLNFWAEGEPLLEEVGRFGGYGEALTILFRAPESHNQLTLDGMHYDNTDPTNRRGRDVVWESTREYDFFTAWHQAYRGHPLEPQAVDAVVRRTVLFVKDPGYAVVMDAAWLPVSDEEGPYFSVTQNWHSPFPFAVVGEGQARTSGKAACLVAVARPELLRRLETGADFAGSEATGPGPYPERHYLRARRWMEVDYRGATGVETLLYPFRGRQPRVRFRALPLEGAPLFRAGAFEVRHPGGRDVILLDPERLGGMSFEGEPLTSRAELRRG